MHDFKSLRIWKESMDLVEEVYKMSMNFPKEEKYGLTSQIRRSAVSVPSNIAEGAYRNTDGEFRQFLGIANGSGGELYTQLILAQRLGLISDEEVLPLLTKAEKINRMISKLILTLKKIVLKK